MYSGKAGKAICYIGSTAVHVSRSAVAALSNRISNFTNITKEGFTGISCSEVHIGALKLRPSLNESIRVEVSNQRTVIVIRRFIAARFILTVEVVNCIILLIPQLLINGNLLQMQSVSETTSDVSSGNSLNEDGGANSLLNHFDIHPMFHEPANIPLQNNGAFDTR